MLVGNVFGGAVSGNSIVLLGGVCRSNSAVVAGSGSAYGGVVDGSTSVVVNGTLFESNTAVANVIITAAGTMSTYVTACAFISTRPNTCTGYAYGGAVSSSEGSLNLRNTVFINNSVVSVSSGAQVQGGAVYSTTSLQIANSWFDSNSAVASSSANGGM